MRFEVKLPRNLDAWVLRGAGLETDAYIDRSLDVIIKEIPLPSDVSCRYFLSDEPVSIQVTILSTAGEVHLAIELEDDAIGRQIQRHVTRYSVENDGADVAQREDRELRSEINIILKDAGLTYEQVEEGAVLPRSTVEELMTLCEKTPFYRRWDVYGLFTRQSVAKADRLFVLAWLLELLKAERDPSEQIGVTIYDLTVPAFAEDLIGFILDSGHGGKRGVLCLALAGTKHPQAAATIVSVLGDDEVARWGLEALGKLKAVEHADRIKPYLGHTDPEVRREAKKTLRKLGVEVGRPSTPAHLVRNRRSFPKGLAEWSQNLDIDELGPMLERLAAFIDTGFGPEEVNEISNVVDDMDEEQTRTFCFPVETLGSKGELWVSIFMDDIDSPDLCIYASPDIIRELDAESAGWDSVNESGLPPGTPC